jgi:hypothetical protein
VVLVRESASAELAGFRKSLNGDNMHPHTRRITNKQFTRYSPPGGSAAHAAGPVAPEAVLELHDEELSHLANDLAYFRAERYRKVESEDVRHDDIRHAQAEIAAIIKHDDTA